MRLPMSNDTSYKPCCGQTLCVSCNMLSRSGKCPFCRAEEKISNEVYVQRINKRMDMNDPDAAARAYHALAFYYDRGMLGLSQDSRKAHELWAQSVAIKGNRNAHYNLSKSYSEHYEERGVEKDQKKAIFHLETAAILGDAASRCELGKYEQECGNWDFAKMHWMLSAAAGCENCMEGRIKKGYLNGAVTKDEYDKTLREYSQSIEETKSEQRTVARAIRGLRI